MLKKTTLRAKLVPILLLTAYSRTSTSQQTTQSPHRKGPGTLESWTLAHPNPDGTEAYPDTLIVTEHGHPVRKFRGDPLVWSWIFLNHGSKLAYQTGPLHFSMQCILVDLRTGKRLQSVDCFTDHANQPAWVATLQAAR